MVEGSLPEGQGLLGPDGSSRGLRDNAHADAWLREGALGVGRRRRVVRTAGAMTAPPFPAWKRPVAEGAVPSCPLATGRRVPRVAATEAQPAARPARAPPTRPEYYVAETSQTDFAWCFISLINLAFEG